MDENKYKKIVDEMSEWGNTISALTYLVKQVCLINEWAYAEIWCPDSNGNFLTWAGYWGRNDKHFEKFSKFSSYFKFAKGIGLIGKTWQAKDLIINEDIINDKLFLRSDVALKSKFNGAIGIPIIKNEATVCVICFFFEKIGKEERDEIKEFYSFINAVAVNKIP